MFRDFFQICFFFLMYMPWTCGENKFCYGIVAGWLCYRNTSGLPHDGEILAKGEGKTFTCRNVGLFVLRKTLLGSKRQAINYLLHLYHRSFLVGKQFATAIAMFLF